MTYVKLNSRDSETIYLEVLANARPVLWVEGLSFVFNAVLIGLLVSIATLY